MSNLTSTIKSIQDIMRKDAGVDGDAQRISQLGWMLAGPMITIGLATLVGLLFLTALAGRRQRPASYGDDVVDGRSEDGEPLR